MNPCRAFLASVACLSDSNSTKAMSLRPGARRTSLKPGNLGRKSGEGIDRREGVSWEGGREGVEDERAAVKRKRCGTCIHTGMYETVVAHLAKYIRLSLLYSGTPPCGHP